MKIDFYAHSGSPLGVTMKSLWGGDHRVGVGGAELALLTMCDELSKRGHRVRLYNDPATTTYDQTFEQLPRSAYQKDEDRDAVINFRNPNKVVPGSKGKVVWWSCDQYSEGDYREFSHHVNSIVCISPTHVKYFQDHYEIRDMICIDLPVRTEDYWDYAPERKDFDHFIFTSVPDRGLKILCQMWPRIKEVHPNAVLTITSDYRLWGASNPLNQQHRLDFAHYPDIEFLGAVRRKELIEVQLDAGIHLYPCIYQELFCYSVAESLVCGVLPYTSNVGALETTNRTTYRIDGDANTRDWQTKLLMQLSFLKNFDRDELNAISRRIRMSSIERFSPETIISQWMKRVFA